MSVSPPGFQIKVFRIFSLSHSDLFRDSKFEFKHLDSVGRFLRPVYRNPPKC